MMKKGIKGREQVVSGCERRGTMLDYETLKNLADEDGEVWIGEWIKVQ